MELIKLKLLDTDGMTLLTAPAAGQVSLVYMNAYKPGDRVSLEIGTPGQYVVIQFEDTMAPALVYVVKREINFHIPFGEQAITYSPKSFAGACHIIRARFATPEEIAARRNLAYNPYDEHGDTGFFPHAHANVETRGEAVFAARNAIDGVYENDAHGIWPYQSWGINRDPNAALTLDFGRPVTIDELRLTLRADFPHDAWWTQATVEFDDGSREVLELHGSVLRNYCEKCGKFYGLETILHSEGVPRCSCGGTVKPDVVLYEESLDEDVMDRALRYIQSADLLIIGGTSLVVYPAAGLVRYFRGRHLGVINKGETGGRVGADLTIDGPIGEVLSQV